MPWVNRLFGGKPLFYFPPFIYVSNYSISYLNKLDHFFFRLEKTKHKKTLVLC